MSGSDIPPEATGVITIDLDALAGNWKALAALVAPADCGAVVKADAYGLGAAHVIPALTLAGCRTFFVATPEEARAARILAPQSRLFVLDGLFQGAAPLLLAAGAVPVLSSLAEVEEWAAVAGAHGGRLPAALHVDTGLNRLGLAEDEVRALAGRKELLGALDLRLIMSHLACADDPADPHNEAQRTTFERLRALLPPTLASLAASDGLMLGAPYHYDLVRPGYALYGGQAFQGGATPVLPVVTIAARVLQVRTLSEGDCVGYSATWRAGRPSRLAVVAAGYADGFARALSFAAGGALSRAAGEALNRAAGGALSGAAGAAGGMVMVAGQQAPVVGRVSMDLITVDITDVAGDVRRGDLVTLIGPGLSIEAMGRAAGTIGYEVLCRLGPRFVRRYVHGSQ